MPTVSQIDTILDGFKIGHRLAYHSTTSSFEVVKNHKKGESTNLKRVSEAVQKHILSYAKDIEIKTADTLEEILDKRISRLRGRVTGLRGFFVGTSSKELIGTRIEQLERIQGTIARAFGPSHTAARIALGFKKDKSLIYNAKEKNFLIRPKTKDNASWGATIEAVKDLLQDPTHRAQFRTDDLEKLATSVQEDKQSLRASTMGFSSLFLSKARKEEINKKAADLRTIHRLCVSVITNLPQAPREEQTLKGRTRPTVTSNPSPTKTHSTVSTPSPSVQEKQQPPSPKTQAKNAVPDTLPPQIETDTNQSADFNPPSFDGGDGIPPPPPPGIFDFKPEIPPPPKSLGDISLPEGALNKEPFTSPEGKSQFAEAIAKLTTRILELEKHIGECKTHKDRLKAHTEDLQTSRKRLKENENKKERLEKGLADDEVIWLSDKADQACAVPIRGGFVVCSQKRITTFNQNRSDSNQMLKSQSYEMLIKAAQHNIKKHQSLVNTLPGKIAAEQNWLKEASKTYNNVLFPVAKLDVLLGEFKKELERWTRFQKLKLSKDKKAKSSTKKKKTLVDKAKQKPPLARSPSKTGLKAGYVRGLKQSVKGTGSEEKRIESLGDILDKFDIDIQLTILKNEEEKQAGNG